MDRLLWHRRFAPVSLWLTVSAMVVACEKKLEITPPPDPSGVVVAQFDPSHPIPVLRIVPSPTALAQKIGGGLDVQAAPCEQPSPKECLALVDGWPTTTPIVVYFSGELDEASVRDGIHLYRASDMNRQSAIDFDFVVMPRPAPPRACQSGNNGSNPARTYTAAQVAPGIQVVITPRAALNPNTQYVLTVESYAGGGILSVDGKPVEPSDLFSLMNTTSEPIDADGNITNALLRSKVQSGAIEALFPGKTLEDLTTEQRTIVANAVRASAANLNGLYAFFNSTLEGVEAAGLSTRDKLVFVNTWTTGAADTGEVELDPSAQKMPFPNAELMTATTGANINDVRVRLPIVPCGDPPTPGCDSPTSAALKTGLNIDPNASSGFSTTAPIVVTANRNVNLSSFDGRVLMYRVNDQGAIVGAAIPVTVTTATKADGESVPIWIRPARPLAENTTYVIGLKRGLQDSDGAELTRPALFSILLTPEPLVVDDAINPDAMITLAGREVPVGTVLQCSAMKTTGEMRTPEEALENAVAIETMMRRPRWQRAVSIFGSAPSPVAANDLLLAFTYKTEAITNTLDAVKNVLMPGPWEQVRTASATPRVFGPVVNVQGAQNIFAFLKVADNFCVGLCMAGMMAPIPPNQCANGDGTATATVAQHPLCQTAGNLMAGEIGAIRMYLMANYVATKGNPFHPQGGTFTPATILQPRVIQTPIWVVTPARAATSTVGYEVAMFQHGLARTSTDGFLIANSLAGRGIATVMMDLPFHGTRASDILNNATSQPCVNVDPKDVACNPQTHQCQGGCDGQQDFSSVGFFSSNPFAMRDNFRQAIIDHLTLLRAIQEESGQGEVLSFLDGGVVSFVGHSLGGIAGGNVLAYAPEMKSGVLNAAGGGLVTFLLNTVPQISRPLAGALVQAGICTPAPRGGCEDTPAFRQFLAIMQWVLDPGDPLANSIGVVSPRGPIPAFGPDKVLMQVAMPDRVMPNATSVALASAYGFDTNPPANDTTAHLQIFRYPQGSDCHGFLLDPSTCAADLMAGVCNTLGAQAQVARFVSSGGATVGPRTVTIPGLCQ